MAVRSCPSGAIHCPIFGIVDPERQRSELILLFVLARSMLLLNICPEPPDTYSPAPIEEQERNKSVYRHSFSMYMERKEIPYNI